MYVSIFVVYIALKLNFIKHVLVATFFPVILGCISVLQLLARISDQTLSSLLQIRVCLISFIILYGKFEFMRTICFEYKLF